MDEARYKNAITAGIATLRTAVEQSLEWRSPLYINFVDYEKVFDSLDRNVLWDLMGSYGIPRKIISLVRNTYDGTSFRILHDRGFTDQFSIKTGVRQGCLLSPFLFLLAIDWVMKVTTTDSRNEIQWTLVDQLEDLDFAADLAPFGSYSLSCRCKRSEKTTKLEVVSSKLGLNNNREQTTIMGLNNKSIERITINNHDIEEVTSFTYLGSVINITGGTDEGTDGEACSAFNTLGNTWRCREITTATKMMSSMVVKPGE